MEKEYIPKNIAVKLKNKGFAEPVCAYYRQSGHLWRIQGGRKSVVDADDCCAAPTVWDTLKWLREKHHVEFGISYGFPFVFGRQTFRYHWNVVVVKEDHLEYPMDDLESGLYYEKRSASFEDAALEFVEYVLDKII